MNRRGEKRVGFGWSLPKEQKKRINNIGEQMIVIYIGKSMEKVTYVRKIKLSRP